MSKRQSLRGKGIDSLLFGISENNKEFKKTEKRKTTSEVHKLRTLGERTTLANDFERITVPLKRSQVEALANLEHLIMKSRSTQAKKRRITKNSIIRACLDVFLGLEFDFQDISDEAELIKRFQKAVSS